MKFRNKITGFLAATAIVGSALAVAPATVAPVQTTQSASAVVICGVPSIPAPYRLKLSYEFSYRYFDTYTAAYNYLHLYPTRLGTIWKWVYDYTYCEGGWQVKHIDTSKTV